MPTERQPPLKIERNARTFIQPTPTNGRRRRARRAAIANPYYKARHERVLLAILSGAPCTFGGDILIGVQTASPAGPVVIFQPLRPVRDGWNHCPLKVMSVQALEVAIENGGVVLAPQAS